MAEVPKVRIEKPGVKGNQLRKQASANAGKNL